MTTSPRPWNRPRPFLPGIGAFLRQDALQHLQDSHAISNASDADPWELHDELHKYADYGHDHAAYRWQDGQDG